MLNNLMKLFVVLLIFSGVHPAVADEVTLFAAASTTNAITEVVDLYNRVHEDTVKTSFASSSTLAKQVRNGAPADIFISANTKWMDYLEAGEHIVPDSRLDLLANRLVLVAPEGTQPPVTIGEGLGLTALLKGGYLAMGDASHVPAGMYAKEALESLGLWEGVKPRTSNSKDVRAALLLVERGETPLGIVYATDAKVSGNVDVVGMFPASSHPPIKYPVAVTTVGYRPAVRGFMDFLAGETAAEVFRKYGFERY